MELEKLQKRYREIRARLENIKSMPFEELTEEIREERSNLLSDIRIVMRDIDDSQLINALDDIPEETRDAGTVDASEQRLDVQVVEDRETLKPWESFGHQLRAVATAATPGGTVDKRLKTGVRAASGLQEGVPSDGGFLVQKDYSSELLRRTYETSVIAPNTMKMPLSASSNGMKINAVDETTRATSRWGGIIAYWTDEAGLMTATKPKFREMNLQLRKLTGLCYATDEMLQDSAFLGAFMTEGFAEEFGFKVDEALFDGDGASRPLGMFNTNNNAIVTVAKEVGQAATTLVAENVIAMWARAYGRGRGNMVWYINQDIEPQLHTMTLAVGTGGVPLYMPANGLSGSPYATLYGRPVIPLEHCETLGTKNDIVFCDPSQYIMIDKGGMQQATSIHVRFLYNETCFKFLLRIDGQPTWNNTLTPKKGTNTQSPFINLATRS